MDHSGAHFPEMVMKYTKFLRVYMALRTGIPGVAKRCFTNGFLVLFIGTFGPRRPPPAPPAAAAAGGNLGLYGGGGVYYRTIRIVSTLGNLGL